MSPSKHSELVFYIRHQRGFTGILHQHALHHSDILVPVLVDGPYGGIDLQAYNESDHLLVIAGGSGAGWLLPFIEQFLRYNLVSADEAHGQVVHTDEKETTLVKDSRRRSKSGPLSLRVILATRDVSSRIWFLRTVNELLSKSSAIDLSSKIHVQVYLTGEAAQNVDSSQNVPEHMTRSKESTSSAENAINISEEGNKATMPGKEFEGRPQLPLIIQEKAAKVAEAGESLGVFVCGPTTLQNDVRNAVAEENLKKIKGSKAGGVYLHSEHFSWA